MVKGESIIAEGRSEGYGSLELRRRNCRVPRDAEVVVHLGLEFVKLRVTSRCGDELLKYDLKSKLF